MESFVKADIFFFITTVVLILVAAILLVVLFYVLRIIKDIMHVVRQAREESDKVFGDIKNLRATLKEEGTTLKGQWKNFLKGFSSESIFNFIKLNFKKDSGRKNQTKKKNDNKKEEK